MGKKNAAQNMIEYIHNYILTLNQSKIFAGLMIIIINIASKFVTFKFSKSMESYLKFTFSKNILVFAITWMGTRDIYISILMTCIFIFITDFLMNENSMLCCLPESFINTHVAMLEGFNEKPSDEEIDKCKRVLERAEKNNSSTDLKDPNSNPVYSNEYIPNIAGY